MPQIAINGTTIHYNDQGAGLPVVLLHGFPLDSRIFEAQLAGLSDQFRIITPDLPGFGQSTAQEAFTIESLADIVHAFIHQLRIVPCVLGGLSMGGYVCFAHVTRYPADLKALLLIDTRCEADSSEARHNRIRMVELVRSQGARAVAEQMMPKMLSETTRRTRPELVAGVRAIMESCPPLTIERALMAMCARRHYCDELPSIAVPTLIVAGQEDPLTTPAMAHGMAHEIPHAQVAEIANAAHLTPMDNPAAVNEALRQFLSSIS